MYGNTLLAAAPSSPPSTLHTLALVGHIVGVAFGVGGATATDMVFVRGLRLRHMSSDDEVPPAEKPTPLAPPTNLRQMVNTR